MGRNTLCTPELMKVICDSIKSGAWDYVAAEAAGVSQATFYAWLAKGQEDDAAPIYIEFLESVTAARAAARQTAERAVLADKPEKWLLQGPGRHKPSRDGWTSESSVTVHSDAPIVTLSWDGKTQDAETQDADD